MDIFISDPKPPPYDPDNLFNVQVDYEPIKKMIEYLLNRDRKVTAFLQNLTNNQNFMNILNPPVIESENEQRPSSTHKEIQEEEPIQPDEKENLEENGQIDQDENDVTEGLGDQIKDETDNVQDAKEENNNENNNTEDKKNDEDIVEDKKEDDEVTEEKKTDEIIDENKNEGNVEENVEENAQENVEETIEPAEVVQEDKTEEEKEPVEIIEEKKIEEKKEPIEDKKDPEETVEKTKKDSSTKVVDKPHEEEKTKHEQFPKQSIKRPTHDKKSTLPPINIEREIMCSNTIQEMQEKIANLEEKLKSLEEMNNSKRQEIPMSQNLTEEPHVGDVNLQIIKIIEKPKENFIPEIPPIETAKKGTAPEMIIQPFDSSELEKKIGVNIKEIKILKNLFEDLSKDFEHLKLFTKENLESIPHTQVSDPSIETRVLSELSSRIPLLEEKIQELDDFYKGIDLKRIEDEIKDLRMNLKKMNGFQDALSKKANTDQLDEESNRIFSLELLSKQQANDTKCINDEIARTRAKMDLNDTKLSYMARIISELQGKGNSQMDKFKEGMQKYALEHYGEASITDAEWNEIKTTVFQLNKTVPDLIEELGKLREIKKLYIKLQNEMEQKLDKKDFEAWKSENDLQEMFVEFSAQYIARIEFKRELEKVRRRMAYMENMNSTEDAKGATGDKAMIMKRGLGGWSCASCAKNLINLSSRKVSFYPWAKLPNDGSLPAKLSYSRMLSLAKPEDICKSQRPGQSAIFGSKDNQQNKINESLSDNEGPKNTSNILPGQK